MSRVCLVLLLITWILTGCGNDTGGGEKTGNNPARSGNLAATQAAGLPYTFVGKEVCSGCHAREAKLYANSQHDLAMQPADKETILGNFNNVTFTYDAITSTFFQRNGKFLVNTDGPDGTLRDFEIKYTFGVTPLQQYLIQLPGGRLQALGIAWDTRNQQDGGQHWFHLYPKEQITYRDELHWTGINQNWNYMCAECHTTGFKKNYDPDNNSYHSTWAGIDVSCEACHGPGSRHAALAASRTLKELRKIPGQGLQVDFGQALAGKWNFSEKSSIASLDAARNSRVLIDICARCHSRRTTIDSSAPINKPLYDTHVISLLEPGLYYPDGQVKGEVYVYGSFIQSKMYAAGVNCNDCHDPHSARLRLEGNALCLRCHKAEVYDTGKHHHHASGTAAARCTACHMPAKKFMQIDTRYDHSFRIPRPDLSVKLGTPNTCNQCHTDRSPQWAADTVVRWYGKDAFKFQFGEALAAARRGDAGAGELLVRVITDSTVPAIARATAMKAMETYINSNNIQVALDGLDSGNAQIRSASLNALAGLDINDRYRYINKLLADPVKSVRINAARLLAPLRNQNLPAQQEKQLDSAIRDYIEAQKENCDRAYANVNLGNLYTDSRRFDKALEYYNRAITLEAGYIPAYVNLADLYRLQNRNKEAESVLRRGLDVNPRAAVLQHTLGLTLVREKRYDEALTLLGDATRLAPDNTRFLIVYAVALNSLGKSAKALALLTAAYDKQPRNRDLLVYLATLYRDSGNLGKARQFAQRLVQLAPADDRQAAALLESVKGSSD